MKNHSSLACCVSAPSAQRRVAHSILLANAFFRIANNRGSETGAYYHTRFLARPLRKHMGATFFSDFAKSVDFLASLPLCLFASLPLCLFASLPLCLFASLPLCLFASLPLCLFASLPLCLFASLRLFLFASLPLCLFASLRLCLFASLPLCVFASLPLSSFQLLASSLQNSHHPSARNAEHLPRHIIRRIRRQKFHCLRNVIRRRRPPHRKPRIAHPPRLFERQFLIIDVRRIHHVHRDSILRLFQRQRTRKCHHPRLRRRVRRNRRLPERALRSHRAQIHNSSPPLPAHNRNRRFARVKHAQQIRIQHLPPLFDRRFRHRAPVEIPHVVHQHVQPPKSLRHRRHQLLRLPRVHRVRFHRKAFASQRLQLPQRVLRRRFVRMIRNRHARALAAQTHRDSLPDSAAPARNQRHSLPKTQL